MTLKELVIALQDTYISIVGYNYDHSDQIEYCSGIWLENHDDLLKRGIMFSIDTLPDWFPWDYVVTDIRPYHFDNPWNIEIEIVVADAKLGYAEEPVIKLVG